MYLLGVLVFALGIAVSIALHEIGHLVPAKRFGVKVTQYMVGFGPTVWSRRRGETEYGVKAIPLGGYIRMIGMFPPKPGDDPRFVRSSSTGRLGLLVESARQQSMEEVLPGDEDRVFYRLPVRRKLVVMLGGPVMNLVIATVLLTVVLVGFGTPGSSLRLESVSRCVLSAAQAQAGAACSPSDPPSPAVAAGLRAGDVVTSVDGAAVGAWSQVQTAIRNHADRPLALGVERDGRPLTLTLTPARNTVPVYGADDQPVLDASGAPRTEQVGFVGVSPAQELQRQSVTSVPGYVGDAVWRTASVVVRIPAKMVAVAQAAFGGGQRDPNGPVSIVGVGRISGEVASLPSDQTFGWAGRISNLLGLIASLNLALFVFNLVPLLPLDGGHVAGALWEGARRQVARWRDRPDPGPTDTARLLPVAYVVSSVLVVMSALLIYADVVNPIRLTG